ncbi:hypothetical protein HDV00_001505 [Rhizophlyctis rosea]|nr:hypothetical protein HDV00_001505 [Rhizophlyctis rosea]
MVNKGCRNAIMKESPNTTTHRLLNHLRPLMRLIASKFQLEKWDVRPQDQESILESVFVIVRCLAADCELGVLKRLDVVIDREVLGHLMDQRQPIETVVHTVLCVQDLIADPEFFAALFMEHEREREENKRTTVERFFRLLPDASHPEKSPNLTSFLIRLLSFLAGRYAEILPQFCERPVFNKLISFLHTEYTAVFSDKKVDRAPHVRTTVKILHIMHARGPAAQALEGMYVPKQILVAVLARLTRNGFAEWKEVGGEEEEDGGDVGGLSDVAGKLFGVGFCSFASQCDVDFDPNLSFLGDVALAGDILHHLIPNPDKAMDMLWKKDAGAGGMEVDG